MKNGRTRSQSILKQAWSRQLCFVSKGAFLPNVNQSPTHCQVVFRLERPKLQWFRFVPLKVGEWYYFLSAVMIFL